MKMKLTCSAAIALTAVLLFVPAIHAQDFSKYRNFSFGMTLADLSKQIDGNPGDIKLIHERPARIEELTWWPPQPYDASRPAEPVGQILFSFYNGALYRMMVTYDNAAVKGLTDEDMIRVISAKYGVAARPSATLDFPTAPSYRRTAKVIARWEDAHYSLNLVRSPGPDSFALVIFSKSVDAQAATSIADSEKLETQEAPQKEAARTKRDAADLEGERQKNMDALRP